MNFFDISMTTPFRQKVSLEWCADRRTTIGVDPEARIKLFNLVCNFMIKHLTHNFL